MVAEGEAEVGPQRLWDLGQDEPLDVLGWDAQDASQVPPVERLPVGPRSTTADLQREDPAGLLRVQELQVLQCLAL